MPDIEIIQKSFRKFEKFFIGKPKEGAAAYDYFTPLGEDRLVITVDAGKALFSGVNGDVERSIRKLGAVFHDLSDITVVYVDTDRGTSLYLVLPFNDATESFLEELYAKTETKFVNNKRCAADEERHAAKEIFKNIQKAGSRLEGMFGPVRGKHLICGALRNVLKKVVYPCRELKYP